MNKRVFVDGKKKTVQVADPLRAPFYVEMYKLRASEKYSDEDITEKINAMGFKTKVQNLWDATHTKIIGKRGAKPLSVKQLQRVIQKPIYCGVNCEKWTHGKPIKTMYDGLVSIELFNKANKGTVFIKENGSGELEMLFNYLPDKVVQKETSIIHCFHIRNMYFAHFVESRF